MINSFIRYVGGLGGYWKNEIIEESNQKQKIDFSRLLPQEITHEIFSYLNAIELGRCLLVSKNWKVLASHHDLWNILPPRMAFGKEQWETFFGDIGKVPSFPKDLHKILEGPCPFWPGKKIKETHMLVLIPETVNGRPLNLIFLKELIKTTKKGYPTQYRFVLPEFLNEYGDQTIHQSHWLLMTKEVIPGSRNKSYTAQQELLTELIKQKGIDYEVPTVLDAAICIFMKYISVGELTFHIKQAFTRCQEKTCGYHIAVGGFSTSGLDIYDYYLGFDCDHIGIAALRKFF